MNTEELLQKIAEIESRVACLPKKMDWLYAEIPRMIEVEQPNLVLDPTKTKMVVNPDRPIVKKRISDPHERIKQRRNDIVDVEDPQKKPIIHFHGTDDVGNPDRMHPIYEKDWFEVGSAFIHMRPDTEFLIETIRRLLNGNA